MNRYEKELEEKEKRKALDQFFNGHGKDALHTFQNIKIKHYRKFYGDIRDVLLALKEKKEQRLNEIQDLDIHYITLEEAKTLGKENEWWSAYAKAARYLLATLPSNPKNGNITYTDSLFEMEGYKEEDITPFDIYLMIETYKDSCYEDNIRKINNYKSRKRRKNKKA